MTERLALQLMGATVGSYPQERKLLQLLIDYGMPEDLLVNAYFENSDPAAQGHQSPAMRELFRRCNYRFGKGFLVRPDEMIPTRGGNKISAAVRSI